ncbi:MAG: hypothetical protein GF334_00860, partial [Candidatus Altiarchaeales archaeon]|nr:hypothetical protein [Candidatus Altiarchaeales archaeon]
MGESLLAEELVYAGLFFFSLALTYVSVPWFIKKLREARITGADMNKEDNPKIPEMGGLAVLVGFIC